MNGDLNFAAGWGIFNRISHNVIKNLSKTNRVGAQCRQGWRDLRLNLKLFGFDLPIQHIDRIAQDPLRLDKLTVRIHAYLNTAQVEQVIDQRSNMLDAILNAADKLA